MPGEDLKMPFGPHFLLSPSFSEGESRMRLDVTPGSSSSWTWLFGKTGIPKSEIAHAGVGLRDDSMLSMRGEESNSFGEGRGQSEMW